MDEVMGACDEWPRRGSGEGGRRSVRPIVQVLLTTGAKSRSHVPANTPAIKSFSRSLISDCGVQRHARREPHMPLGGDGRRVHALHCDAMLTSSQKRSSRQWSTCAYSTCGSSKVTRRWLRRGRGGKGAALGRDTHAHVTCSPRNLTRLSQ